MSLATSCYHCYYHCYLFITVIIYTIKSLIFGISITNYITVSIYIPYCCSCFYIFVSFPIAVQFCWREFLTASSWTLHTWTASRRRKRGWARIPTRGSLISRRVISSASLACSARGWRRSETWWTRLKRSPVSNGVLSRCQTSVPASQDCSIFTSMHWYRCRLNYACIYTFIHIFIFMLSENFANI